ncbi:MAG: hypothetical protein ABIZ80_10990 [Bryobacteraceae bacterium]
MTRTICLLVILVSSMSAEAVRAIGSLICAGPVAINGIVFDLDGIVSWPVAEGDKVTTKASPAVIVLLVGGRVVLDGNTRVSLNPLRLISGRMHFTRIEVEGEREGSATLRDGKAVVTRGGKAPPVEFDSWKLLRRLPYTLGEFLRRNR